MRERRRTRRQQGSAGVEGVVGLWLVVVAIIFGTLLLVNVGSATYCKEKLGFIANQAADYAAVLPIDATRHGLVLNQVKELLVSMGYPSNGARVTITDMTIATRTAVKITVTTPFGTFMPAAGVNVIPPQITMSDSAIAVSYGWYPAYAQVQDLQGQQTVGIIMNPQPGPGPPGDKYPNDTLPVYALTYFSPQISIVRGGTALNLLNLLGL